MCCNTLGGTCALFFVKHCEVGLCLEGIVYNACALPDQCIVKHSVKTMVVAGKEYGMYCVL